MTANKNPSTGIPTPTSASARDIATSGQATAAAEQAVPSWDDIGRAVVIGGGSGMGRAIAAALVAAGSRVTIVGRSEERLARAVRELRSAAVGAAASADADAASGHTVVHSAAAVPAGPTTGGGEVDWMVADIGDEVRAARLFEQIGPVDHVISTAADVGGAYGPIGEFDFAAGRGFLDTKLIGSMLVAKYARVRAGGSLTFTSGIAAYRPAAGGAMVAAVNGALESLAYALAVELGPTRVNVVSPGWVRTSIWDRLGWPDKEQRLAAMAGRLPAGRLGTPEDIAAAVLSLLRNPFVTGTVLHVDGGHRLV
ncbi:3-oxoacyl-[acyl-carrier-protein] reductase FabG [Nocardia otitidiscaviarum]|uniref:3-oxoacyl-[acyl-carrier-protein] reductase FabG n=1 Tax=Nocardia otitidiscaviarum TaxID=1823 RepID=A0A378YSR7_9NOCA|nr:SDR family oxidoreductase [Nocardia otitidiscaviarum]SUA79577.1 3-oxoacyl-[acyl-carrier-protein] reductase FabG [Nocardia otitidiscaviarum]